MGIIFLWASLSFAVPSVASPVNQEGAQEHNLRGMNELKRGNPAAAEVYFRRAVAQDASVARYHNNLGVALMRQARYREAARSLKVAVEIDPGYAKALANLSITEFYLLNFTGAFEYYRRALAADREYTGRRINKKNALPEVRRLRVKHPDNSDLEKILRYLEEEE